MFIIRAIYDLISYVVVASIIAVVVLMLARLIMNYADLNPFGWAALTLRRITDPLINPIRRGLSGFGIEPKIAPLVTILIVILLGWFTLQLSASLLNTAAGVLASAGQSAFVPLVGYLLYGLLSFYSLLIFIRIIFSWGMVGRTNRLMRFLVQATDPLLVPLRRMIPPLAMFDLSPIIAFFMIWLFQSAIAGTLLRGLPLSFLG